MKIERIKEKVEDIIIEGQGSWECEHDCVEYDWSGDKNEYTQGCWKAPEYTSKLTSWF